MKPEFLKDYPLCYASMPCVPEKTGPNIPTNTAVLFNYTCYMNRSFTQSFPVYVKLPHCLPIISGKQNKTKQNKQSKNQKQKQNKTKQKKTKNKNKNKNKQTNKQKKKQE